MIQWVRSEHALWSSRHLANINRPEKAVPVVRLDALRDVVEGLTMIKSEMQQIKQRNQDGYIGDKQSCERVAAESQRLLALLERQA